MKVQITAQLHTPATFTTNENCPLSTGSESNLVMMTKKKVLPLAGNLTTIFI
jgi:hypothetical protein